MSISTYLMLAILFSVGFYNILARRYVDVLFGIALTSNAINLLLINTSQSIEGEADPLPQALILTAIVIGFGIVSFLAAFILNRIENTSSDLIPEIQEEVMK
jgi:multicomponent Na+:H+ antiporter subunit C